MSEQYTHRNGETEPPTESGHYWARGSLSPDDDAWGVWLIDGVIGVIMGGNNGETNEGMRYKAADSHSYSAVVPGTLLCRWWGPVTPPWDQEP